MRIAPVLVLTLALGAASALAGTILGSAPIPMPASNNDSCLVANIGPKDLNDVTVSIFKTGTTVPEVSTTCAVLAPNGHCGYQSNTQLGGVRFCVVTLKGSPKAIRGDFCDLGTGRCTPIR